MYNLSLRTTKILYLVVHDTGNKSVGASAVNNVSYFKGGDRQASADEFIDEKGVAVFNADMLKNYSWAVGDGNGAYGITNNNSISVEICVNADGNYAQAVTIAVGEVKRLMALYKIDLAHVVRHWDCSHKACPNSMMANNWAKWIEFKNRLGGVNVATSTLLRNGSTGTAVVTMQKYLNLLGYNCGVADGIFGAGTDTAVRAFQKAKGLSVDGIVGTGTLSAMVSAVAIKNKPVVPPVVKPIVPPVVKPIVPPVVKPVVPVVVPPVIKPVVPPVVPVVKTIEQRVAELERIVAGLLAVK